MRPYVIVNVAMSADGKLSTRERRQVRISGSADFARVDELKAGCDAVMVGIGTVLADDPSLTVKSDVHKRARMAAGKSEHPVRVIIDSRARIPVTASVFHKGDGQKVIAVSAKADVKKISALEPLATIITAGSDTVDLAVVLDRLYGMGIRRLMVEGGGTLIASLFACGLVDEFSVFIGNIIIGGKDAPTPADGAGWIRENDFSKLTLISAERMENGVLLHWRVGS